MLAFVKGYIAEHINCENILSKDVGICWIEHNVMTTD